MIHLLAQESTFMGFDSAILPKLVIPLWVISILLVIIAIVWFLRRRGRQKAGTAREVSPGALRRVWKAFLRNIPGEFRRSVLFFQPFVVFGEAGAGKSLLIGKYTDWKGQAAQFYPSYSVDPNLQIYLGSRALVQEIPATLLADTTPSARAALVRLWAPLFRKRQPIVVLTLSAAALRKATPESLRMTAQTVRGKINVLSRLIDKPIQVRVVLSHMDQVEGYLAFSQFVEKQEIPSQIKLDQKSTDAGLSTCLEPFETYLPLALTTVPSKSFLKILTFLNKAPETFVNLGMLLRTVKENDPLSYEPEVSELFLTSDTSGSPSAVSNPFASSWLDQSLALQRANRRRHALITTTIAVLGLAYLGFSFWYARRHLVKATGAIETFENSVQSASLRDADLAKPTADSISNFAHGTDWPVAHALMPTYFATAPGDLRARFVQAIRQHYIVPALANAPTLTHPHERTLFLLALLYASQKNDIGRFILAGRAREWERATGIPAALVEGYVRETDEEWTAPAETVKLLDEPADSPFVKVDSWLEFLGHVEEFQSNATLGGLTRLKAEAVTMRAGLNSLRQSFTSKAVYRLLQGNQNFPRADFQSYIDGISIPGSILSESDPLEALFELLDHSDLTVVSATGSRNTLNALSGQLNSIFNSGSHSGAVVVSGNTLTDSAKTTTGNETAGVTIPAVIVITFHNRETSEVREFKLETESWFKTLSQGRMRLAIAEFAKVHKDDGDQIFFNADSASLKGETTPLTRGPGSDFLFARPYVVPRKYSRAGYDEVKKATDNYEHAIAHLLIPKTDRDFKEVDQLVGKACDEYGREYARHWGLYYNSWSVDAHSVVALKAVVAQMRLTESSVFQEFLAEVRTNTQLPKSESPYLGRIASNLTPFQQVNRLFPSTEGVAAVSSGEAPTSEAPSHGRIAEFEKYRVILDRIAADLDTEGSSREPRTEPADLMRTPVEFTALLSPVARLSYAIVREGRDSYLKLIDEWLDAEGITGDWRRPFLEPVRQLHVLGIHDIQTRIADSWERRVLSQVGPLLDKFPFSKVSTTDATPQDVQQILFPTTGYFWVTWRNLIAPMCIEKDGVWKPLGGLPSDFKWPSTMFETTNAVARVTDMLWNKETKNPQALTITIQPEGLPVPSGKHDRPEIILGFLSSGKSSVFAFNQKPAAQKLSIEWWLRPNAQVGIQVGDPSSGAKSFRAVTEPDSAWSFYHLLLRDRQAERNVYVFNLTQGEPEYPAPILKFAFQEDPWEAWSVPTSRIEKGTDK